MRSSAHSSRRPGPPREPRHYAPASSRTITSASTSFPAGPSSLRDQETQKVSSDCCTLNITHGKYVLAINPVFIHASGVDGGRVGEILPGRPSVIAVIGDDDAEDVTSQCAQWSDTHVSKKVTLRNLYIDPEKKSEYCNLSLPPHPVWFASFDSGEGPESDYSVALTSTTSDLNALPRKDSPELRQVISDVTRMLRTLRLKPPIVITKVVPASAPPGATVTIYGSGFKLLDRPAEVSFREFPNNSMPPPQALWRRRPRPRRRHLLPPRPRRRSPQSSRRNRHRTPRLPYRQVAARRLPNQAH